MLKIDRFIQQYWALLSIYRCITNDAFKIVWSDVLSMSKLLASYQLKCDEAPHPVLSIISSLPTEESCKGSGHIKMFWCYTSTQVHKRAARERPYKERCYDATGCHSEGNSDTYCTQRERRWRAKLPTKFLPETAALLHTTTPHSPTHPLNKGPNKSICDWCD